MPLPTDLKPQHKADKDRLAKLSGPAFDEAYASHMVKDHQKAVSLFSQEAKTGADPDTKEWAARTLATLEKHLDRARQIAGQKVKTGDDHQH